MTTLREAAQMALDALEEAQSYTSCLAWSPSMTNECAAAAEALRAALAQPEPTYTPMRPELRKMYEDYFDVAFEKLVPPQREWQSLTEQDVLQIRAEWEVRDYRLSELCRAIEAKLKEKNT